MGRPSSFDREAAIETAMQEMWRIGYQASTVKTISETLGINRSSYYNAFASREGLFKEVLAAYAKQTPDRILYGDLPDRPISELITGTFREICKERAADPEHRGCLAVNCLVELTGDGNELGQEIVDAVMNSANKFQELLEIAVARGELPNLADTRATALALQNLMVGLSAFAKALTDEDELWLTVKTTLIGLGVYQEGASA
ncbi:TetR/AcrR family transcriptional regulator [Phaeobacter sp. C3_T13_0]|uniref:TetR/AcrR family transcriptional regulator n=1 Tax=Phaeobacter cretensis TaxID=3342641 RepID=UPI0039BC3203